jgi:hypothetical protein
MTLKVLTANRLRDGDVVYLTADQAWSEWLEDAELAESPEAEAALVALGEQAIEGRLVVDPYLMPVTRADGGFRPVSQREIIRARGPSIRLDLGKQSVGR